MRNTSDAGTLSSRFVPNFVLPCHLLEALNGKAYRLIPELAQAAGPPPTLSLGALRATRSTGQTILVMGGPIPTFY